MSRVAVMTAVVSHILLLLSFSTTEVLSFVVPSPSSFLFTNHRSNHCGTNRRSRSITRRDSSKSRTTSDTTTSTKTLYEILGVSSDADRPTLKKAYAALARKTHPDALRSSTPSEDENDIMESFDTIARAYRTLSDPLERKRYDRELKAKAFTVKAEKAIDSFAPILKKGVVLTNKGFEAMKGIRNGDTKPKSKQMERVTQGTAEDWWNTSDDVLKRRRRASTDLQKAVLLDVQSAELSEQSRAIQKKVEYYEENAIMLNDKLSNLITSRIHLSLTTPNSPLSSYDALRILDGLNTIDSVTLLDTVVRQRHTTSFDIEQFAHIEKQSELKLTEHKQVGVELQELKEKMKEKGKAMFNADKTVESARLTLRDAVESLNVLRREVEDNEKDLELKANLLKRTMADAEAISKELVSRRETVRDSLRRVEEVTCSDNFGALEEEICVASEREKGTVDYYKNRSFEYRMALIEKYLEDEYQVRDEISQVKKKSSRLIENPIEELIDLENVEFSEQSRIIQEQAKEYEATILTLNDSLSDIMTSRIRLCLNTPDSPLNSDDAVWIFESMNTIDPVTDRTKHTTSYNIGQFSLVEKKCELKLAEQKQVEVEVQNLKGMMKKTGGTMVDAERAEKRARKSLEEAVGSLDGLKREIEDCERTLCVKENLFKRTRVDAGTVAKELVKKRETVRESLRRKEAESYCDDFSALEEDICISNDIGKGHEDSYNELSFDDRVALIEKYRSDEKKVMDEIFMLEKKLSRLSEESIMLIERIKAIEDERLRMA